MLLAPYKFGLELLLDVGGVEGGDDIGHWPAHDDRPVGCAYHLGHFVETRGSPHCADMHAVLQPQVL